MEVLGVELERGQPVIVAPEGVAQAWVGWVINVHEGVGVVAVVPTGGAVEEDTADVRPEDLMGVATRWEKVGGRVRVDEWLLETDLEVDPGLLKPPEQREVRVRYFGVAAVATLETAGPELAEELGRVAASEAEPEGPEPTNHGPDAWATLIRKHWRVSVRAILAAARTARNAWEALDDQGRRELQAVLPFGAETWRRLRELATSAPLDHADPMILPPSWRTLWELSRIDPEVLAEHLDAGHVHAELTVKEAIALREGAPEPEAPKPRGFQGGERQGQTVERYTPLPLLELCRAALGGRIDLDPAATTRRLLPGIQTHYTVDHRIEAGQGPRTWGETAQPDAHGGGGGLVAPWRGHVFLNPPYGRLIGLWTGRWRAQYEEGALAAGCLLVPGRLGTAWWRALEGGPRAELSQRVRFVDGRGETVADVAEGPDPAMFPSVVFYCGPDPWTFADVFAPHATLQHIPERPTQDLILDGLDAPFLEDLIDPDGTNSLEMVREEAGAALRVLENLPPWRVPWATALQLDVLEQEARP